MNDGNQVVIANTFQITWGQAIGLYFALIAYLVDEVVGQIGHIHELGPGPFQAGAEHGQHGAHAAFATGEMKGLHGAHLRPPETGAVGDRGIDFCCGRDFVVQQPKRLTP